MTTYINEAQRKHDWTYGQRELKKICREIGGMILENHEINIQCTMSDRLTE